MTDVTPLQAFIYIFLFILGFGLTAFAIVWGVVEIATNADRIAVAVLQLVGAPVCRQARMVAELIYRHPDQWTTTGGYGGDLVHPEFGRIHPGHRASGLYVEGEFGHWDPNAIERRIIANAVEWHRNRAIEQKLGGALRKAP